MSPSALCFIQCVNLALGVPPGASTHTYSIKKRLFPTNSAQQKIAHSIPQ